MSGACRGGTAPVIRPVSAAKLMPRPRPPRREQRPEQRLAPLAGHQSPADSRERGGEQQASGDRKPAAGGEPPDDLPGKAERGYPRDQREPGPHRAAAEPGLQVLGHG